MINLNFPNTKKPLNALNDALFSGVRWAVCHCYIFLTIAMIMSTMTMNDEHVDKRKPQTKIKFIWFQYTFYFDLPKASAHSLFTIMHNAINAVRVANCEQSKATAICPTPLTIWKWFRFVFSVLFISNVLDCLVWVSMVGCRVFSIHFVHIN